MLKFNTRHQQVTESKKEPVVMGRGFASSLPRMPFGEICPLTPTGIISASLSFPFGTDAGKNLIFWGGNPGFAAACTGMWQGRAACPPEMAPGPWGASTAPADPNPGAAAASQPSSHPQLGKKAKPWQHGARETPQHARVQLVPTSAALLPPRCTCSDAPQCIPCEKHLLNLGEML